MSVSRNLSLEMKKKTVQKKQRTAAEPAKGRKRTEELLEKQTKLLDLANDTIMIRNLDDNIIYWNQGAERLYGWRKDEAIGKYVHTFLKTKFPEPFGDILKKFLHTGHWEGVLVHTVRDGSRITVGSRWTLDRDEQGNPLAYLEINNDITARIRAEEELQKAHREMEKKVEERTEELSKANIRLRALSSRLISAHEEERLRISRELHDDLGQILTSIGLDLHRASKLNDPMKLKSLLERLQIASQDARNRIRQISSLLRPRVLDDVGLKEAIQTYLGEFASRTGVDTQLIFQCENEDISGTISTNIYRILQEALNNISQYAFAKSVRVCLSLSNKKLILEIKDDGIGFDPASARTDKTLGLLGMRERAAVLGGELILDSSPGRGTMIQASFPISQRKKRSKNSAVDYARS